MRFLKRFLTRLANMVTQRKNGKRLREEIEEHIALQTAEYVRVGMSPSEAYRQAALKFGAAEAVCEEYHAEQTLPFVENLLQDLRYAARQLVRSPGFTLAAVLSLAIGIGINTALYSNMDAVVLHPLAVPQLDRVVTLAEQTEHSSYESGYERVTLANFEDWSRQSRSFESLAVRTEADKTLTGTGDAAHIEAALTSANFFAALRATPLIGRLYNEEECRPGQDSVTVLSYGFWQRNFGGDPAILGRKIELDQRLYTIVGVMPRSMQYPSTADVYLPFAPTPAQISNRIAHNYLIIARLRDGVTVKLAQTEMRTLAEHLAQAYPATNAGWSVHVEPLLDGINGPYTPLYYRLILGAALFVLLVVCANIANLQLARGIARRPEIAMRTALGASRSRIVRQLFTENILLSAVGALAGIAVAKIYGHYLLIAMPERVARFMSGWSNTSLNGRALAFSFVLAGLAGLIAGMAPAAEALRINLVDQLKAGSRSSIGSGRNHRLRNTFAVAQIALAVALVIGATLMSRGMNGLKHMADYYEPERMLTFNISLPEARYDTPQKQAAWYANSLARLRALPGVTHAELTQALPYDDNGWLRDVDIENRPVVPGKFQSALNLPVSAGYFAELRIPIVVGRGFNTSDSLETTPVAVVSERFVAQYFPGRNPLGHRIRMGGSNSHEPWLTIVGVAKETNYSLWDQTPHAAVYMDALQVPPGGTWFAITTNGDPLSLAPAARKALAALDPALPLNTVETYGQLLRDNLTGLMYASATLGIDGLIALLLAAIGIFGVMANLVGERTREIGVRLAMGARREDVLGMILRRATSLTGIGLGTGLVLAYGLAHLVANLLRGVRSDDPLIFSAITAIIAVVALVASWLPARRAARIDPMVALRDE
jgi:putative ABC transport system permease protein